MKRINWDKVFKKTIQRPPGLSRRDVSTFVRTVRRPLTAKELALAGLGDNAHRWKLPDGPIPPSYLSFLRWSDGGEFQNGNRLLQFFPALDPEHGVRIMMLLYLVPERVPGILPFAFNGGGIFYAFDMRMRPDRDDEYPIVAAECGYANVPTYLASTFLEACKGRKSIENVWEEDCTILEELCPKCLEPFVCSNCGWHAHK